MWSRYPMMLDHRRLKWAWLSLALLVVFGVIIYMSDPTDEGVEVGENRCFPVHWCIPGTTGESAIDQTGKRKDLIEPYG